MSEATTTFQCACLAAGKPLLCRSCKRRAGLLARRGAEAAPTRSPAPRPVRLLRPIS